MVEMQKQKLELAQKKRDHVKNKQAMLSELIAMSKKPDIQPKVRNKTENALHFCSGVSSQNIICKSLFI